MKGMRIWGVLLLAGGLLLPIACEMSRQDEKTGDSIRIDSVTSKSNKKSPDTLVVSGAYELVSADYGDIDIGFNTDTADPEAYFLVSNATKTVAAGTGGYEIAVSMTATNWPSGAVYSVYVSLSVPLHSIPWQPLADATTNITFDE